MGGLRVQDAIDREVSTVGGVGEVFSRVVDGKGVVPFYDGIAGLKVAIKEEGALVVVRDEGGEKVREGDFF